MKRFIATRWLAISGALLMVLGAASLWAVSDPGTSGAAQANISQTPPSAANAALPELTAPPPPDPKSREQKRFDRADKDDDGLIQSAEYLATRRRNYDKLDSNADGRLSFEEYAASGFEKFNTADSDGNGALAAGEFATTAPKPKKPTQTATKCICPQALSATVEN